MAKSDQSNGGGAFGWQLFWSVIALLMVGTVGVVSLPAFYEVYGWITSGDASFETIPSYTSYGISLLAIIAVVWVLSRSGSQNALLSLVAVVGLTALGSAPYLSGVVTQQAIADAAPDEPVTLLSLTNLDQLKDATVVELTLGAADDDLVVAYGESVSQGAQFDNMLFYTFTADFGYYWIDAFDRDAAGNYLEADNNSSVNEADTGLILYRVNEDYSLEFTEYFDDDGGFLDLGSRIRGYIAAGTYLAIVTTSAPNELGTNASPNSIALEVRKISRETLSASNTIRSLDMYEAMPTTLSRRYDKDSLLKVAPDIYRLTTHFPDGDEGNNGLCSVIDVSSVTDPYAEDGVDPSATLFSDLNFNSPLAQNDDHAIPEASGVLDELASLIAFDSLNIGRNSAVNDEQGDDGMLYVVVSPVYGDLPGAEFAIRAQLLPIMNDGACDGAQIEWATYAAGNTNATSAEN